MFKAKVTAKGQITVPVEVRNAMGLKPGERIVFLGGEKGEFIVRRVRSIMEMAGCLAGFDVPKSDAEMNELIAAYASELDEATKSNARAVTNGEAA